MNKRNGELFVISAPSGTGKTTLCNMLLKKYDNIKYSVSYTTRSPRDGELQGVNYNFIDLDEFNARETNGDFLEYALVHGNYYATSKSQVYKIISQGYDVIMDIDTQGANKIKKLLPKAVSIFILPPSIEELKNRINKRDDNTKDIEIRMLNAVKEIKNIFNYDYYIINNDINEAFNLLCSIYLAQTCSTKLLNKNYDLLGDYNAIT